MAKAAKPPKPGGGGSNNLPSPTGLEVSIFQSGGIFAQWNPVADAQGYWVYINGVVYAIVTEISYTASFLTTGTYDVQVAARFSSGVLGPKCAPVTITLP